LKDISDLHLSGIISAELTLLELLSSFVSD